MSELSPPPSSHQTPYLTLRTIYALAGCLMMVAVLEMFVIRKLHQELASARSEIFSLKQSNALMGLRITTLEAKDPAYVSARIIIAWDPNRNQGVVSLQNLLPPPAGREYQLWVLDPRSQAPISAGLLSADTASRRFEASAVISDKPGFAVTLEPTGGQSTPTLPILFAVAPEE